MDLEQNQPEIRSAPFLDMEVSSDGWSFDGLAGVYDEETDLGDFTESQSRGAYRKVIGRMENVPMLYHHRDELPVLATTKAGTLQLRDDVKGLRVKATIAQHYVGEAVRALVKSGDIGGMSTGFIVGQGNSKLEARAGGKPHRTITDFRALLDVSPTWLPAYTGTNAEMRSLGAQHLTQELERLQQLLAGTAPQREERATEAAPEAPEAVEPDGEDAKCDKCATTLERDVEHTCAGEDEQRSGADSARADAAARRRRLQLLGLTLPE